MDRLLLEISDDKAREELLSTLELTPDLSRQRSCMSSHASSKERPNEQGNKTNKYKEDWAQWTQIYEQEFSASL